MGTLPDALEALVEGAGLFTAGRTGSSPEPVPEPAGEAVGEGAPEAAGEGAPEPAGEGVPEPEPEPALSSWSWCF